MSTFDPGALEWLAAIVEEGGFERATQRRSISQSAVSRFTGKPLRASVPLRQQRFAQGLGFVVIEQAFGPCQHLAFAVHDQH